MAGLYALWAWLFVVLGTAIALLGPALPQLRRDFGLSLAGSGLVFMLHSTGYLAGVFAAGPLADIRGRRPVMGAGLAVLAAGMALAALAPRWPLLLGAMVVAGAGFAFIDVGLNAAIADAVQGTGRRAAAMNLLHGAFPAGTLVAPAALAGAYGLGLGWRTVFAGVAALIAASLLPLGFRRFAWPPAPPSERGAASPLQLLREPHLRHLALLQGLYVGVELGIAGWVATYLIERFGASESAGALATSLYWAGFLAGRPVVAFLTHRFGAERVLPWLMVTGIGMAAFALASPAALPAAILFALTGAAICGVFPTVMALALEGRAGDAGSAAALVTGVSSVGGLAWPWLVGAVAQVAGLRAGMATAAAPLVAMLLLSHRWPRWTVRRRRRRSGWWS